LLNTRTQARPATPLRQRQGWLQADDGAPLGSHAWPLRPDWQAVLHHVLALGPIRVRSGDGLCQLEARTRRPRPAAAATAPSTRTVVGLRTDTSTWACGMATQGRLADGQVRRGFSFFDSQGRAVLALDLDAGASPDDLQRIVRQHAGGTAMSTDDDADGPGASRALPANRPIGALLAPHWDDGLAVPLASDAILDVLRDVGNTRLPLWARFCHLGVQFDWRGPLHQLTWHDGTAQVGALDFSLRWREAQPGLQTWLLRTPTSVGLQQSLALVAPDGTVRLQLAPDSPSTKPQPCAWRTAIQAACDTQIGSAC